MRELKLYYVNLLGFKIGVYAESQHQAEEVVKHVIGEVL